MHGVHVGWGNTSETPGYSREIKHLQHYHYTHTHSTHPTHLQAGTKVVILAVIVPCITLGGLDGHCLNLPCIGITLAGNTLGPLAVLAWGWGIEGGVLEACGMVSVGYGELRAFATTCPRPPSPHPHHPPKSTYQLGRRIHTGTAHRETTGGTFHSCCSSGWGCCHSDPRCTGHHTGAPWAPVQPHWGSSSCCWRISGRHPGWSSPWWPHPGLLGKHGVRWRWGRVHWCV